MPQNEKIHLPDAELDLMLALWKRSAPAKIIDLYNDLQAVRPCSKPAIHTLLERLRAKGFVAIESVEAATPYKRITPILTEEEYRRFASEKLVDKLYDGSWSALIASLVESQPLSDDELDELTHILDKKRS